MNRTHTLLLAASALLCGVCTGCDSSFRAETVLHADGAIDRAVYQPAAETPEAARDAKLWKQLTFAPEPYRLNRDGWPDALTELPAHAQDKDHPYLAAWNHFASVKDVPDHVLFYAPAKSGLPDGKLRRELIPTDLGYVVEYHWRETLTDVVALADMRKARTELADMGSQFLLDVLAEAEGKEYDLSGLAEWLKMEGKPWLAELTDDVFVYSAAVKGPDRRDILLGRVADCCARHGLHLSKDGKLLNHASTFEANTQIFEAAQNFAVALLAEKVKKDGRPIGREAAEKWIAEAKITKEDAPWGLAAKKMIEQKYGGEEAFDANAAKLLTRIVGLYLLKGAELRFDYTMTFPGPVVATNGELMGAGDKVRWRFEAADAYPLGYVMEARCLFVPEDARKALGGQKPLSDRTALTAYAEQVRGQERLLDVLRQCRKDGRPDALKVYIAGQNNNIADDAARAPRILNLLKGL